MPIRVPAILGFLAMCMVPRGGLIAQDKADEIRLEAPKNWKGERITIPPTFAPDMKLRGVEEIRFAPGMFRAEADDFFTYVIVFRLARSPEIGQEVLQRELLVYYKGLANAVSRGELKTDKFRVEIKPYKQSPSGPAPPKNSKRFTAQLKWIEPFSTRKEQTLRMEIDVWRDAAGDKSWSFLCVSPKSVADPLWKQMRQIRDRFHAWSLKQGLGE